MAVFFFPSNVLFNPRFFFFHQGKVKHLFSHLDIKSILCWTSSCVDLAFNILATLVVVPTQVEKFLSLGFQYPRSVKR